MRERLLLWVFGMGVAFACTPKAEAQTVSRDTVLAIRDSVAQKLQKGTAKQDSSAEEMVLDVIYIKGYVEKPGVIVMPKRVEPELPEVELERSFQKELKEGVGEVPKPDKELGEVEKVKSIKKTVERKRE